MSRGRRLQPARDVAEQREREAAAELARAQRTVAEAEQRLADLHRFRDEYAGRLAMAPGGGLNAALLKDTASFVGRVDGGLAQAGQYLEQARRQCEQRHAEWVAARVRTRAIGKLSERHEARDAARAARGEQREQDEYAGRRGR